MTLLKIESSNSAVYAHYNPNSITMENEYQWNSEEGVGNTFLLGPVWAYMKNPTLSVQLIFDDFRPGKQAVQSNTAESLSRLYKFAHPKISDGAGAQSQPDPVYVYIGGISFKGVLTKIKTEITGVDSKFTPTRAFVDIEITRLYEELIDAVFPDTFVS